MNRPPASDFVFGHHAAVWLATGTLAVSALAALGHACSWLVPVGALLARSRCISARGRVVRWRRWTEAWSEMEGEPQVRPLPSSPPAATPIAPKTAGPQRRQRLPRSALIAAWLLLLGWFTVRRNEPPIEPRDGLLALCLVMLSAWGALAALASLARRIGASLTEPAPRAEGSPERDTAPERDADIVTQCLPVPPAPQRSGHRVTELLPDYARALLTRSREAIPSSTSHSNHESEKSR